MKKILVKKTRVVRDGVEAVIDKKDLAMGDIVLLDHGTVVPADLRLIKEKNLVIDESVLTGESVPATKDSGPVFEEVRDMYRAKNIAFAGTSVLAGKAEGVVVGIGKNTAVGEIARLAAETVRHSTYEKKLQRFSNIIFQVAVVTVILFFAAHIILRGYADREATVDYLIFCFALVVGIIPEALPVVTVFGLSQGAARLAKEKVVVKRLSAIEDLGDVEILCTDKTGTLTENRLVLEHIAAHDREKMILYGLLSSEYAKEDIAGVKNPFDNALFEQCSQAAKKAMSYYEVLGEIVFDSERDRNSVLAKDKTGKKIVIVKGAPEVILKLSSRIDGGKKREIIEKELKEWGMKGSRTLAVACKTCRTKIYCQDDEAGLTFLGDYRSRA